MIPPIIVVCQLSFEAIKAPLPLCSSNVGFASAFGRVYGGADNSGPIARRMTVFGPVPWTIKPAIMTLSPVCTKARVEMLPRRDAVDFGIAAGVAAKPITIAAILLGFMMSLRGVQI